MLLNSSFINQSTPRRCEILEIDNVVKQPQDFTVFDIWKHAYRICCKFKVLLHFHHWKRLRDSSCCNLLVMLLFEPHNLKCQYQTAADDACSIQRQNKLHVSQSNCSVRHRFVFCSPCRVRDPLHTKIVHDAAGLQAVDAKRETIMHLNRLEGRLFNQEDEDN